MTDLSTKLLMEVHDEAKKHRVSQMEAHRVFFHAYEKHKRKHGSFRGKEHYTAKMNDRYRYMYDEAIKYIQENKQR